MSQYVSLRLRKLPVVYWLTRPDYELEPRQEVVVKTQHGQEVGTVLRLTDSRNAQSSENSGDDSFVQEIIRVVNDEDRAKLAEIKQKERDAFLQARDRVADHKLSMKLLKAEYLFDYSRLILYFKSEKKVDFRDLLKSLASTFKTRIELRQVGVRDETKLLGGIGCCGKEVCCSQFMTCFYPVSTRMAKEQNLSLNPAKLSGICGRLLCCLAHEYKFYASFHGKFPKLGAEVVVGEDTARVMDINYITGKILLGYPDRHKAYFPLDAVNGRKDDATGRNLWWVSLPGETDEPDLSVLLRNLNPPGSGKKKKKKGNSRQSDDQNQSDSDKQTPREKRGKSGKSPDNGDSKD